MPTSSARTKADVCYWCNNAANSSEHLFSQWFDKAFTILDECAPQHMLGSPTGFRPQRIANYRMEVEGFCKDCNSGWMSDLEEDVKPILGPMMNGRRTKLGSIEQLKLAEWAVLKSFVLDGLSLIHI